MHSDELTRIVMIPVWASETELDQVHKWVHRSDITKSVSTCYFQETLMQPNIFFTILKFMAYLFI